MFDFQIANYIDFTKLHFFLPKNAFLSFPLRCMLTKSTNCILIYGAILRSWTCSSAIIYPQEHPGIRLYRLLDVTVGIFIDVLVWKICFDFFSIIQAVNRIVIPAYATDKIQIVLHGTCNFWNGSKQFIHPHCRRFREQHRNDTCATISSHFVSFVIWGWGVARVPCHTLWSGHFFLSNTTSLWWRHLSDTWVRYKATSTSA